MKNIDESSIYDTFNKAKEIAVNLLDKYIENPDADSLINKKIKYIKFDKTSGWIEIKKKIQKQKFRLAVKYSLKYVAFIPIILVSLFLIKYNSKEESFTEPETDSFRAILFFEDGESVDLKEKSGNINLKELGIENFNNVIDYSFLEDYETDETVYHELFVPKCGEYQLKLSDGTLIYLNSLSRIRYPVKFTGDLREVEFTGEGYFIVVNNHKPFIVNTSSYDVKVLGTEFNLSHYEDEEVSKTTLVNGKVSILDKSGVEYCGLAPDFQFQYNKFNGRCVVENVDVRNYTAWKDGSFRISGLALEEIMNMLVRWYDIEVIYEDDDLRGLKFSFNISRHETIDPIIRIFEMNGKIKINRENNILIINKGR